MAGAYTMSARVYDKVYSFKDYRAEADRLRELIRANTTHPAQTLLDVACGTAEHLVHLRTDFACAGVDLEPVFLETARTKLPDVPFHRGDMRTFELGQTFDVVMCLFSAIGYMLTVEDLHRALATMARHVAPGGVLLVEGWFTPDQYKPGGVHMRVIDEPDFKLTRMNTPGIRGHVSVMDMHHLVGTPEGVEHFVERHELGMYTEQEYLDGVRAAGLTALADRAGLMGRTLYIGRRDS